MTASPSGVHGIEHVGITVPDMDAAIAFFAAAFDAVVLYELRRAREPIPDPAPGVLEAMIGVVPGTRPVRTVILRLGSGANLELFEYAADDRRPAARPSDFGLQHVGVLVDDIDAAAARVVAAGGEALSGPHPLPRAESGPGNLFRYTRAPWGTMVELVALPSPQQYFASTPLRKWRPVDDGAWRLPADD